MNEEKYVRHMIKFNDVSFPQVKHLLYPLLANRWHADITESCIRHPSETSVIRRDLTDNITTHIAFNTPKMSMLITKEHLTKWNRSEEEVFEIAINNLRQIKHTSCNNASWHNLGFVKQEKMGLFCGTNKSLNDSSLVLIEDFIRLLPVKGDPIALVNTDGFLFVAGSDDPESLSALSRIEAVQYWISNIPIRLSSKGWTTYLPPKDHLAYANFKRKRAIEHAELYQCQRDALISAQNELHFASPCDLHQLEDETFDTCTTWTKNVDPLLPKTDWVKFIAHDDSRSRIGMYLPPTPWEAVQAVLGYRMKLTVYSPPRYQASGFPSDAELEQLKKSVGLRNDEDAIQQE